MANEKALSSTLSSHQNSGFAKHPVIKLLNTALFDLNSPLGKVVNIFGMIVIVFSVGLSMVSTLDVITEAQKRTIDTIEFSVTLGFTLEYFLRLLSAHRPRSYAFGFYGIIDLLTWLPLLFFGDVNLAIRLLRLMRLLKLIRYLRAMHLFLSSLQETIDSLIVVICAIIIIILFSGNLIHAIEPETFPDAFLGSWWALVTMTTVGYGDVVPLSGVGKLIAACLMLCGITMFAMLTATISVKIAAVLNNEGQKDKNKEHSGLGIPLNYKYCPNCGLKPGETEISHCKSCQQLINGNDNYCSSCGKEQTAVLV